MTLANIKVKAIIEFQGGTGFVYWHTLELDMHAEYRPSPHPIRVSLAKLDWISFEYKRRVKLAEEIIRFHSILKRERNVNIQR